MNKFLRFLRGVLVAAGAISVGGGVIALADYAATQGSGTTFGSIVVSAKHYMQMLTCDPATPSQCVAVSAGGAAKVDGSAVTQPVSGTVTATGTVAATQSGTWTVQPGNTANTTAWKVDGSAVTQPVSGTVTANAGTNLNTSALATAAKQPALGTAGSASADVLTVQGIASMTPLLATLSAETTKVIGTVRNLGNAGAITDFVGQAATAPANAWLVGATFFTTPTTLTNGQASPLQMDNAGNLLVNIKAGAGSGGTALADNAAFTQGTTNITPIGCFYTAGTYTSITTVHSGVAQCTIKGGLYSDVNTWAETSLGVPTAYGTAPTTGNYIGVNAFVTNTNANGSAVSASSSPVVIASDQAAVAVKAASGTIASGAIASGAIASGAVASGAVASGAYAAGSIAAGAYVSGSILSGALASGAVVDITNMSVATGAAPPSKALYLGANAGGATGGHVAGLVTCDSHVFKHITSATDTLAVQGVASQTIRICGWRSRAAGTATWFLENTASANANCSSSNTQITGVASEVANSGETVLASFWTGLANTSGNGLCINSTGTGGVDIDIWYNQF